MYPILYLLLQPMVEAVNAGAEQAFISIVPHETQHCLTRRYITILFCDIDLPGKTCLGAWCDVLATVGMGNTPVVGIRMPTRHTISG